MSAIKIKLLPKNDELRKKAVTAVAAMAQNERQEPTSSDEARPQGAISYKIEIDRHELTIGKTDTDLLCDLRSALNHENPTESVIFMREIFRRAIKYKTLPANISMVSSLVCATSRVPRYSLWVVQQMPPEIAELMSLRILVEFIDRFSANELEFCLTRTLQTMRAYPQIIQRCLAKVVVAENNELFFLLVGKLENFNYDFTLQNQWWLLDQSEYTHGPRLNPATACEMDLSFLTLIEQRGTPEMQAWARLTFSVPPSFW